MEPNRAAWDAEELVRDTDARRRNYRRLQSWYRQEVLGQVECGKDARNERSVGSMLTDAAVDGDPTLNFLAPSRFAGEILEYVEQRVPEVFEENGSLAEHRLYHNMLSSMPLCFNLFAPLRNRKDLAAQVLTIALGIEIREVVDIKCEWAPGSPAGLGDRTAFDAAIRYRDGRGNGLLGIETKYTEPFSQKEYAKPDTPTEAARRERYETVCNESGWFLSSALDELWKAPTNQLWRNTMLAASCERLPEIDHAMVAVISLHADPHARKALRGVRSHLQDASRLVDTSLERLIRVARGYGLDEWANAFERRYLDLGPILPTAMESDVAKLQKRLDRLFPGGCVVHYDNEGGPEPYVFNCPRPVALIDKNHLAVHLWREGDWSGTYPAGVLSERPPTSSEPAAVFLDGGRFLLSSEIPPAEVAALRTARIGDDEVARIRASHQP